MRAWSLFLLSALLTSGCVVDRTGKSATYILQDRVDSNRLRVHTLEKDLALQVTRVDDMANRAATARKRLADSGATLETFLEELQALRGEVSDLNIALEDNKGTMGAVEFRLAALEARLSHMEKELDITPPLILPPMESEDVSADAASAEEPDTDASDSGDAGDESNGSEQASEGSEQASEGEAATDEGDSVATASLAQPAADEIAVSSAEPSAEDVLFQQALVLMKKKEWEKAGSRLQRFLRNHSDSSRAIEAQFLTGQCLFELGRYKASITTYQKAIELDEDGPFAPRSMFMQALAFEELGTDEDLEAAKVFFGELVRLYPSSDDADRAKRKLEALDAD